MEKTHSHVSFKRPKRTRSAETVYDCQFFPVYQSDEKQSAKRLSDWNINHPAVSNIVGFRGRNANTAVYRLLAKTTPSVHDSKQKS